MPNPNPMTALTPWVDDAPTALKQEMVARFDELKSLQKEQVAVGTTAPNTYGSLSKFVANPSSVSVETYQRMIDTDETIGSGIDFMNTAMISRWGEYKHPNPEIEKFVRRAIDNMDGSWHTNLDEMISAEWAGYSVTEVVWSMVDDFDGAPAFVPRKLVTYQPLTLAFAVDPWGELLADGVWQYQRYHNQYMAGAYYGREGYGDLNGFRPDIFASRGDLPYPVRVAADVSLLTVKIPTNKVLHLTSSSTGKFRNPYGRSILRRVYKNWVLKDAFLKMWTVAADRKGTPLIVGYAPSNDTILHSEQGPEFMPGSQPLRADQAMANSLSKIHNSSFVVIPGKKDEGFSIESVQVTGDMNVFLQGLEYFNKAIMRGLLIPPLVMTGGDGGGSYALGDAHKQVFREIIDGKNKVYKAAVLNQFIRKIIAYNFPRKMWEKDGVGEFVVEDFDPDVMDRLANVFTTLTNGGFMSNEWQEDVDHVRSRFGLPKIKVEDLGGGGQPDDDLNGGLPVADVDETLDNVESKMGRDDLSAADDEDGDGEDRPAGRFATKLAAGDFDEKKHPRADDGKFGSGGGSSQKSPKKSPSKKKSDDSIRGSKPTPEQARGLRTYTGSASSAMRQADLGQPVDDYVKENNDHVNSYLEKAPKFKGTIYRGIVVSKSDLAKVISEYSDGAAIDRQSKESWTKDERAVSDRLTSIAKETKNPVKVFFEYPESEIGVDISADSRFPEEQEVLAPPNTRYKVKAVTKTADGYRITFEQ